MGNWGNLQSFVILNAEKYSSTRWLSLPSSVELILKQYSALHSCFLSQEENESDRRLTRLQVLFSDSMTEVFLLFYQSVMPVFTIVNLLQRNSPCIYFLREAIDEMFKTLLGRFVTLSAMDTTNNVVNVNFASKENQLSERDLMVGFKTKEVPSKLQDEVEPIKFNSLCQLSVAASRAPVVDLPCVKPHCSCVSVAAWHYACCLTENCTRAKTDDPWNIISQQYNTSHNMYSSIFDNFIHNHRYTVVLTPQSYMQAHLGKPPTGMGRDDSSELNTRYFCWCLAWDVFSSSIVT